MASPIQNSQAQGVPNNPNPMSGQQQGVPKSQQGTGYLNLNTLMNANQGNKLGSTVAGGIEQTGQQASNALQQGQQTFNQQSQANALGTQAQQQYVQNTLGNLGIGGNGQPNANPTNVQGPSASDIANFQQYEQGQYAGPTNIANISSIQNQAQNAQQQGQQTSTSGGRQALLQQYAANPGTAYNQGEQSLDTTLLGATGGNQLNQARQAVSGLTNQVNSAQAQAQQQAAQLQNQAQGFGQAVTGQVTNASNQLYGAGQSQAQADNTANAQGLNSVLAAQQAANSGQISQGIAQGLGLSKGEGTYGVNVGQYVNWDQNGNPVTSPQQLQQATALNVMGQPQYQQYAGLQQLLGKTPQAQGNAFQQGAVTYTPGAQAAIQAAAAPYTNRVSGAQNIVNLENQLNAPGTTIAQQQAITAQLNQMAPGSQGGTYGQNVAWANSQLAQAIAANQAAEGQTLNVS